jgi:hypothetical protein
MVKTKKCSLKSNTFCIGTSSHHGANPSDKGLLMLSIYNTGTNKTTRRMAYRDPHTKELWYLNFCPWCGSRVYKEEVQ